MDTPDTLVACANCGRAIRATLARYACPWCQAFPFPVQEDGSCGTGAAA